MAQNEQAESTMTNVQVKTAQDTDWLNLKIIWGLSIKNQCIIQCHYLVLTHKTKNHDGLKMFFVRQKSQLKIK